jgi:membrane-associated phospholipid phosphatase
LERGLECIRWLQGFRSPVLDLAMRGFSALGNESFFLLLFPFLYWCLDSRLGLRVSVVYFLSGWLNHALKQALAQPRPMDLAAGINLVEQSGYGLPSGHAQGAVVLWGLLALEAVRRGAPARSGGASRWVWAPAALLMLGIGLSRVYLGVHFPTDVLAGWAVGAVVLAAAAWALGRLPERLRRSDLPAREAPRRLPDRRSRSGLPVRRSRPGLPVRRSRPGPLAWWAWIPIAGLLAGAALALLPQKDSVAMVAGMLGFLTGHLLRRGLWNLGEEGSLLQRLLRLPAGLVVLLGLYLGLKRLFPAQGQALYLPLRFVRYLLAGGWAALGAPLLFRWIGLARLSAPDSSPGPGGTNRS